MILNMSGGGPSATLNFRILGDTTQPDNPVENTIWVNTSTKITGWEFSTTQPAGEPGKVWFKTAASSVAEFNALKKNSIHVYPIQAYQWDGSAWVSKVTKIYQNGEWKAFTLTVVPNLDSYGSTEWKKYCTENSGKPSVSVSSTTLTVTLNAYKNDGVSAAYIPVNVTGYSKMTIAGSYTVPNSAYGANLGISVGLFTSVSSSISTGYWHSGAKDGETITISENSYDISTYSGICYFEVRATNYASTSDYVTNPTVKLTKVKFE